MIGLIMCAGRSIRLKEETKDKPKCMVEVNNKPILEHIADHMNKHGIWRIVVNLHSFPEVVMKNFGQRFLYLYEPVPMGEFATISLIRSWFPYEELIIMNGDTITNIDISEVVARKISGKCISIETGEHMGTTVHTVGWPAHSLGVSCQYFDCGTTDGLALARKHYEH